MQAKKYKFLAGSEISPEKMGCCFSPTKKTGLIYSF